MHMEITGRRAYSPLNYKRREKPSFLIRETQSTASSKRIVLPRFLQQLLQTDAKKHETHI
jgi:hypothetical protein